MLVTETYRNHLLSMTFAASSSHWCPSIATIENSESAIYRRLFAEKNHTDSFGFTQPTFIQLLNNFPSAGLEGSRNEVLSFRFFILLYCIWCLPILHQSSDYIFTSFGITEPILVTLKIEYRLSRCLGEGGRGVGGEVA